MLNITTHKWIRADDGDYYYYWYCDVCKQNWWVIKRPDIDIHSYIPPSEGCIGENFLLGVITNEWIDFYEFWQSPFSHQERLGGLSGDGYGGRQEGDDIRKWTKDEFEQIYGEFIGAEFSKAGGVLIYTKENVVLMVTGNPEEELISVPRNPIW